MSIKLYIDGITCKCGFYKSESIKDCPQDCPRYAIRQREVIKFFALKSLNKALDEAFEKNEIGGLIYE